MGKCREALLPSACEQESQAQPALGHQTSRAGRCPATAEFARTLPLDTLSSSTIARTLNNSEISEMSLGSGSAFMIFIKMEKHRGVCSGERGGMRDATAATGAREGCGGQENSSLLRGADRVVCSSLELAHTHNHRHRHRPTPNTLSVCTTALVLSKDGTSERRNSSVSRLGPFGSFRPFRIFSQSSKIP